MTKKRSVSHSALVKSLDRHPAMPAFLKSLPPRAAAIMFQRIGIGDATVLMAMVPAQTLLRTLDESIWKSPTPGMREGIDVSELIGWLEAWNDLGETFLLERLAAMSDDYLVLLLSCLIQVYSKTQHPEYEDVFDAFVEERPEDSERFGPFDVLIAAEPRDVVRATLHSLWADAPERLLRILGRLHHAPGTPGTYRGWTTTALDVEFERQAFREAHGYVSVEGARAFLATAESVTPREIAAMSEYDPETRRHLLRMGNPTHAENPVTAAADTAHAEEETDGSPENVSPAAESLDALRSLLENAELLEPVSSQLLLTGTQSSEPELAVQLRRLAGEDSESFQSRARELAYLANVLKVSVRVQDTALTDHEAKDAAFAACNLGIELAQPLDARHLHDAEPGLIRMFLFGWHALRVIPQHVATAFEQAFNRHAKWRAWLREEVAVGLRDLTIAVKARHWGDARDAVVFLTIAFDTSTCRAILPLLDEIPRYSLLLETGKRPDAARWIASKRDLDRLGQLLAQISVR